MTVSWAWTPTPGPPYAIVDTSTGACLATGTFPTTAAAIGRAIAWMQRTTNGNVLAAVEGTSSYGAGLSRALRTAGIPVAEVKPPRRQARAGVGKSDPIDAVEAARQVLHRDVDRLAVPRADGLRSALRVLLTGRRGLDTRRAADRNALNALVRTTGLGVDARKALDIIVKIRMVRDETTRLYTQRRTADGRTCREIKRALKRYTARVIFRGLQTLLA
jgi:hypothetical protein